jgi:propanol-preferring alcohol dehydrogenase
VAFRSRPFAHKAVRSTLDEVRALRLTTYHEEAELLHVDDVEPASGQVVVKVGAAGACHSDLHMMHGSAASAPWPVPFTLGHETAGWVHAVGAGVTSVELGQPVAVYGAWGCGTCGRCLQGMDNLCEDPLHRVGRGSGLGLDGGMAEYMAVPDQRYLVPLPEGLTPFDAAPLTDAGLTPFHAIRRSAAKLGPSATALVIGIGGLGHVAVQILKATTAARVVTVDTKAHALELAASLGADAMVLAGDGGAHEVQQATGGRGADLVLDCVGSVDTLALAAASARTMGDITLIGVAGGTLPFRFGHPANEVSVQSVYWGSRSELVEVLELAARGFLKVQTTAYPLERAIDAYRDLATGEVLGRAVVVPEGAS